MADAPALSICVPTWNHADLLERLLASVESQLWDEVQVVVADNGSTDATPGVVAHLRRRTNALKHPLVYTRAPENRGFDANLRRAVRHATGKACWLVGDDDELPLGAVARVLDTLRTHPGALVVGDVTLRSRDPAVPLKEEPSTGFSDRSVHWLTEPRSIFAYLSGAATVRAAFPFISNVVFPRAGWLRGARRWEGTSYTHLFRAWELVLTGTPVVVRRRSLVLAGVGNHHHRDADSVAQVLHSTSTATRLGLLVPPGLDRAALHAVWLTWYTPEYVKTLAERCQHEPSWAFALASLEQLQRSAATLRPPSAC